MEMPVSAVQMPTYGASLAGFHDPDNHRLTPGRDGLTRIISPLYPHNWQRNPAVSEEVNTATRLAALKLSKAQFLAQMQTTQCGYSYTVSEVARTHPERAVNIPGSKVWVVVMPPPEQEKPERDDHIRLDEDYNVVVLDGLCRADLVEDGAAFLRQVHSDTGRPHSLFGGRRRGRRRDPWNGRELADGEVAPDHLPEAVAAIGEFYLIHQRPSFGGTSESLQLAIEAVRAHGGESAELLERVMARHRT